MTLALFTFALKMGPPTGTAASNTERTLRSNNESPKVTNISELSALMKSLNAKQCTQIDSIKSDLGTVRSELSDKIDKMVSAINIKIDNMQKEFNDKVESIFTDLDSRIEIIRNDIAARATLDLQIEQRISHLEGNSSYLLKTVAPRLNAIERRCNSTELLVAGVPFVSTERVPDIIRMLCAKIEVDFGSCVVTAFRAGKRKGAPIIIRCHSTTAKQCILSSYFKYKTLTATDVGFDSDSRIFINECLTTDDQALYKSANELRKIGIIHKVSSRNGCVVIKESVDSKFVKTTYAKLAILKDKHK